MATPSGIEDLTPNQKWHIRFMKMIVESVVDTPLILKGGTALLLNYGLDRYSEDLDFDSTKHLNLKSKLTHAIAAPFSLKRMDVVKDTPTTSRYRLIYDSPHSKSNSLKVEVSFRENQHAGEYEIKNGIKTYKPEVIIQQKIVAFERRTKARDLYDLAYLSKAYLPYFTEDALLRLALHMKNIDALENRFQDAYREDTILQAVNPADIILILSDNIQRQLASHQAVHEPPFLNLKQSEVDALLQCNNETLNYLGKQLTNLKNPVLNQNSEAATEKVRLFSIVLESALDHPLHSRQLEAIAPALFAKAEKFFHAQSLEHKKGRSH